MKKYNIDAKFMINNSLQELNEDAIEKLWKLFQSIAKFWGTEENIDKMKSNFIVFLSNRIEIDYNYLVEYTNAILVIDELKEELGEKDAFIKLLTDPQANIAPPTTKLARARQLVSNEFISLYLSLGGFKHFGSNLNYPGYFGGTNKKETTPYRTNTYKS
jgi:hypothetical protein